MTRLVNRARSAYPIPVVLWDVVAFVAAALLAWAMRNEIDPLDLDAAGIAFITLIFAACYFAGCIATRQYRNRWKAASFGEVVSLVRIWFVSAGVAAAINLGFFTPRVSMSLVLLQVIAALLLILSGRALWRLLNEYLRRPDELGRKRLVVYGAGDQGRALVKSIADDSAAEYVTVGVLDDDPSLRERRVEGLAVAGGVAALADFRGLADTLIVADSALSPEQVAHISAAGRQAELEVLVLPTASEMLGILGTVRDARPIEVRDLLGRPEVEMDFQAVQGYIAGARVLVTGAGGSIGSELARQVARLGPAKLYMLDRDESSLQQLQIQIFGHGLLNDPGLILADIRDRRRVHEVFDQIRPQVVLHAAALKHLPLLESHPREGLLTNVAGTQNVLEAAAEHEVRNFVNVSTDKAAAPTSVLGSTKRLAEALTMGTARRASGTYVNVRFGNVLGSRGSVLPSFERQLAAGGPLTVTHPDVTRYFMSIPEAVQLILQAGAVGADGETMVLDMGEPVRIVDLAQRLIEHHGSSASITFTGLRPNEKLHEDLVAASEQALPGVHDRIAHIPPSMREPDPRVLEGLLESPDAELAAKLLAAAETLELPGTVAPLRRSDRAR